jgi:hypothetical protein
MEELGNPPRLTPRPEAEYRRLAGSGRALAEQLMDRDGRYNSLLAERGGRIARASYRIRSKLGVLPGIDLITDRERSREEHIKYHESRRADPKGIFHDEDLDLSQEQIDAQRLLG